MYTYLIIFFAIFLESLPISSSGHVLLLQKLLSKKNIAADMNPDVLLFLNGFTVMVLVLFFYNRWKLLVWALLRNKAIIQKIFLLGALTDGITVGFYFLYAKKLCLFPVWIGFLITALVLASLRFCPIVIKGSWNYKNAILLGIVQSLALLPGISRFGTTFAASRWCGMNNRKSFELSFLLEFPIIVGAYLLGTYQLYKKNQLWYVINSGTLMISMTAIIAALIGLWIMRVIISYNYIWLFSIYLIMISFLCIPL